MKNQLCGNTNKNWYFQPKIYAFGLLHVEPKHYDGQRPTEAFAKVDIHANKKVGPQKKSWRDAQIDNVHLKDCNNE